MKASKKRKRHRTHVYRALRKYYGVSKVKLVLGIIWGFILDLLRTLRQVVTTIIVIGIIAGIIVGIKVISKMKPYYDEYHTFAVECVENSSKQTFRTEESSYIFANDGSLLVKLHGDQDAKYLRYDEIPPIVIDAFVAIEDRSFWDNPGIDAKGLARVVYKAIESKGDEVHGASTITQQLARNIFLTHEVSLERKGKEMLIALELNKKYSKREIMEFYVNDICFANAFYGLEAASKGYFNKSCKELSTSQLCYLCAIPNSPEYYNPYKYPERALERRNKILKDMNELGLISEIEMKQAIEEEIIIEKPEYQFNDYLSTYAIDCATKYLMKLDNFEFRYKFENMDDYQAYKADLDEAFVSAKHKLVTGGYKIYTSLDKDIYNDMQNILNEQLSFNTDINVDTNNFDLQGAITVVDNKSGKVVALVGGRTDRPEGFDNINNYSFNRAYQGERQSGSSIKPLVVYTPALEKGYTPDTIVYDINVADAKKKGADVQSMFGTMMTFRSALEQSKNGVAWQTFDKFGADYCMSYLEKMKFASICPNDYFNSSSLGGLTYGVTTVEMAGAYCALENHGWFKQPTCLTSILDSEGNEIYQAEQGEQVYTEKAADTMVDMMTGVIRRGTASKLNWYKETDIVAACKTGTTNGCKDGWLCGFTPYYTVTVWVGYDNPKVLSNLYGNTYPGQIWKNCMLSLIEYEDTIQEFYKTSAYYEPGPVYREPLPDRAYSYLEGRDDDEDLGGGYTVYDYRYDRIKGEGVTLAINGMNTADFNSALWAQVVTDYYYQGIMAINSIKSSSYKAEMQTQLDTSHINVINIYNNLHPDNPIH